ncbi:Extracellular metalloprotease 1 [Hypsizygus marmoreus]|uniref:Extracellular metalloprotease 1 n=1 Tax=Hypsizygus marmoreus TaxID=39966 RepID=A0A369K1M6_HYPMA|nr:Extracellular metalloprotease 1 [Hypsizygus marmoreus]
MKHLSFVALALPHWCSLVAGAPPTPNATVHGDDKQIMICGSSMDNTKISAAEAHFKQHQVPPTNTDTELIASPWISLYFHVVAEDRSTNGGWMSDAQIQAQINVLNADYAPSGVRWRLVLITRTINRDWFRNVLNGNQQEMAMKRSLRRGAADSLNVYTVGLFNQAGLLGFSTFPFSYGADPVDDGVVIKWTSLPGGTFINHNLGRTLTHEVGHWVGLYHTFQGGCAGNGDFVTDTPPEATRALGCPVNRDTCPGGGLDPIRNFMDYTDDGCKSAFTTGQGVRMRAQLRTYRGINI